MHACGVTHAYVWHNILRQRQLEGEKGSVKMFAKKYGAGVLQSVLQSVLQKVCRNLPRYINWWGGGVHSEWLRNMNLLREGRTGFF